MRWYKYLLILTCTSLFSTSVLAVDTAKTISIDSMDRLYQRLQKQSDSLGQKINATQEKIDAEKDGGKVNYWLPVLGGAVVGVGLAWWLKRRKKKE